MGILVNWDLLSVGVAVAATTALGFTVYFSNRTSITNRTFLWFSLVTALWGTVNYAAYQTANLTLILWGLRFVLFCAVLQAFFLFKLFYVFPDTGKIFTRSYYFGLIPVVAAASIVTLTPLVFSRIVTFAGIGAVSDPDRGPGLAFFGLIAVSLVIASLYLLKRKIRLSTGDVRRESITLFVGVVITFALIITFNFLVPVITHDRSLIPLGALFTFPFSAAASYAILRQRLFNIKVAATTTLVFLLAVVSFAEIIFSNTLPLIIFRTSVFVLVLVFGINLIRGVLREVEQREKIEKLATELQETNTRQEGLIHFIGHEVKGSFAKDIGVFASLFEGDFGPLSDATKTFVGQALAESRQGADAVANILKAANLKKGTVTYTKEPFDLKALVAESVERTRPLAEKKGLTIALAVDDASYQMTGDKAQIGDHVLRNLIDNAVNYTPSGSIAVSLTKENGKCIFAVKDSGVGITVEDKKRLFTEGGHGKDSIKVNVHSTGYGLYIAKTIVEEHKGTIRAESAGEGKGSTFIVEFPA